VSFFFSPPICVSSRRLQTEGLARLPRNPPTSGGLELNGTRQCGGSRLREAGTWKPGPAAGAERRPRRPLVLTQKTASTAGLPLNQKAGSAAPEPAGWRSKRTVNPTGPPSGLTGVYINHTDLKSDLLDPLELRASSLLSPVPGRPQPDPTQADSRCSPSFEPDLPRDPDHGGLNQDQGDRKQK